MKNRLNIITAITEKNNDGLVHLLQPSTTICGLNLIILETQVSDYRNHRSKDALLYEYLKTEEEEAIIFFTDGYDAMFVSSEEEILTKYYQANKKILFSAEINCWPDVNLANQYPKTSSSFKYLCSGGFIGEAGYIKKKIEEKLETNSIQKYPYSNQIYWTEHFLRDQENIALDTECEIFVALSSEIDMFFIQQPGKEENVNKYLKQKVNWFNKHFSFKKNRLYNKMTKTLPCHIHANGLSKLIVKEIAEKINLTV